MHFARTKHKWAHYTHRYTQTPVQSGCATKFQFTDRFFSFVRSFVLIKQLQIKAIHRTLKSCTQHTLAVHLQKFSHADRNEIIEHLKQCIQENSSVQITFSAAARARKKTVKNWQVFFFFWCAEICWLAHTRGHRLLQNFSKWATAIQNGLITHTHTRRHQRCYDNIYTK